MSRGWAGVLLFSALIAVEAAAVAVVGTSVGCGDDDESIDAGLGQVSECLCCAPKDPCASVGKCFARTGTENVICAPECTTVGTACDQGGCYYTDQGNHCFEAGTKNAGETCGAAAECVVGVQCLDNGGMFCWQVCAADEDCTEPAVCTDTGLGFSVCDGFQGDGGS